MIPDLEPDSPPPHGSINLDNGYVLLQKREQTPKAIHLCEVVTLNSYCQQFGLQFQPQDCVRKWARLALPSGQIARSAWGEDMPGKRTLRPSRHVKEHTIKGSGRWGVGTPWAALMKAVADDVIGPSPYGQLHCVRELSLKVKERQRGARKGNAAWHLKYKVKAENKKERRCPEIVLS
ncbi:hypothetical protein SERLA73DRAFT_158986 [Serpula lacrymans var. lacrymans S7.3]|uniref:Uncharacterized protein n=1 Tax=Serpula lacrymans var. lacrymans (strain S7.3) TaxID=936435 RepID=F8PNV5_SERL3|nr:hypothetical protein SERLA73DRAFT_158986 [Serpula lacrymans var. lacrymans S7.3]